MQDLEQVGPTDQGCCEFSFQNYRVSGSMAAESTLVDDSCCSLVKHKLLNGGVYLVILVLKFILVLVSISFFGQSF